MFRKLEQFSGDSKLETWLFRLATNEALQYLRHQKRRSTQPMTVEPSTAQPDRVTEAESIRLLESALSAIDPQLRVTFIVGDIQHHPEPAVPAQTLFLCPNSLAIVLPLKFLRD